MAKTSFFILIIRFSNTKTSGFVQHYTDTDKKMAVKMKPLGLVKHIFCYITLGLLCGWYFVLLFLIPTLLVLAFRGSLVASFSLVVLLTLTLVPLKHEPWEAFMYSWIFKWWCEYFDVTYDNETIAGDKSLIIGKKYMFFEFPHGIFPMGQFLSATLIADLTPGHMVCGTGADIIFMFPIMRQIMAWLGTRPAKRANISKILGKGQHCAIIPGGIAEMYLMNDETEQIFFKTRKNTVKAAIEEGANIVPIFFFGNTKIFKIVGAGSKSWLSKLSRRLRASIVLFYGRHGLPVPFRHPIHIVSGDIVEVTRYEKPTEEQIEEVQERVIASVRKLFDNKKPAWETRELIIS